MSQGRAISRPLRIALLACVAVVLFLGGFVAGHFLADRHGPGRPTPDALVERLTHHLSAADADLVRQAFHADEAKIGALMTAMQQSQREVRAKLAAQPFDKAALETALNEARDKREAVVEAVQAIILKVAGDLTPEGRSKLWTAPH